MTALERVVAALVAYTPLTEDQARAWLLGDEDAPLDGYEARIREACHARDGDDLLHVFVKRKWISAADAAAVKE